MDLHGKAKTCFWNVLMDTGLDDHEGRDMSEKNRPSSTRGASPPYSMGAAVLTPTSSRTASARAATNRFGEAMRSTSISTATFPSS